MQKLKGKCYCDSVPFEAQSEMEPEGLECCDGSLCAREGAITATALLAELGVKPRN